MKKTSTFNACVRYRPIIKHLKLEIIEFIKLSFAAGCEKRLEFLLVCFLMLPHFQKMLLNSLPIRLNKKKRFPNSHPNQSVTDNWKVQ